MAPKRASTKEKWKNVKVMKGAVVQCRDACTLELMRVACGNSNPELDLPPYAFFLEQSRVPGFKKNAAALLNPLGKKRIDQKNTEDYVSDESESEDSVDVDSS